MDFRRPFMNLINVLNQYEAMIEETASSILDWEALTSRTKSKGVERWKRKNDGVESVVASALSASIAPLGEGKVTFA
ncbi:UNVERIFIED_CONTAM: hypothetical protein Sradi_0494000 [Sesamum radiatum]|uniref:Uncharacterized protein n=1 Tax=Sesamum radiatum TaxID=300843 RepID=A0AAW2WCS2_SESRA